MNDEIYDKIVEGNLGDSEVCFCCLCWKHNIYLTERTTYIGCVEFIINESLTSGDER